MNVLLNDAILLNQNQDGIAGSLAFGSLGPGVSAAVNVNFGNGVPPGSNRLRTRGTFGGGTPFSGVQVVTLPSCSTPTDDD